MILIFFMYFESLFMILLNLLESIMIFFIVIILVSFSMLVQPIKSLLFKQLPIIITFDELVYFFLLIKHQVKILSLALFLSDN